MHLMLKTRGLVVALQTGTELIGVDGHIPWHHPWDLQRFKLLTMDTTVIMGRKTWMSLPVRPLKGRRNIVLSSMDVPGAEVFRSLPEALDASEGDVWFIGGPRVYEEALKLDVVDVIDATFVPHAGPFAGEPTFFYLSDHVRDMRRWHHEELIHPDTSLRLVRYHRTR